MAVSALCRQGKTAIYPDASAVVGLQGRNAVNRLPGNVISVHIIFASRDAVYGTVQNSRQRIR
jgi:hypothetical protein